MTALMTAHDRLHDPLMTALLTHKTSGSSTTNTSVKQ